MSSTIDQQFVEFIVKSLVGDPDSVSIVRTIDEKGVLLELSVAQEDLGRVIGKRGVTAQSIRTLLRALGTKNEARYNLKIVDPEGPAPKRDDSSSKSDDEDEKPADEEEKKQAEETLEEPETVIEEEPEEDEDEAEDDDDSMVARHRRDIEDLDDDEL